MARKVILDVDTGTDDAVAIMFAALHPELELLGVTTVNGNVPLANTTDNTLRVLDWIGHSSVPVFAGLSRPLVREGFPGVRHFGSGSENDPHGYELDVPAPVSRQAERGAVQYLVETLRATTEPITLVAVGPLSNVAAALALDPGLVDCVEELVIMGGGHARGNVTASAEFNIWADPEAAAMVFAAGFPQLTLVTLDATHQAVLTRETCRVLNDLGTPAGIAAARFISKRIDAYAGTGTDGSAPVHDVVCTAYLVAPQVITTEALSVAVETHGTLTVGRTVVDTRPGATASANAQVALSADPGILADLLTTTFA